MLKEIKVMEWSEKAFRPFGRLVERPSCKAYVESEVSSYWHNIYGDEIEGNQVLSFFQLKKRAMNISEMERHMKSAEVFISICGNAIMVFAPAVNNDDLNAQPDMDKASAFLIDGKKSFVIGKGVWHTAALPLGDTAEFLLVLPDVAIESNFSDTRRIHETAVIL